MPNDQATLSALEQQILKARMKVGQEMPDVADAPIEPMGWFDRLVAAGKEQLTGGGKVVATANPAAGTVKYSPEVLGSLGQSGIEDTLAHELVHVRQGREAAGSTLFDQVRAKLNALKEGYMPYGQQPQELEAYQYEGDRAVREGREPSATPNFSSPGMREKGNIRLTSAKEQAAIDRLRR